MSTRSFKRDLSLPSYSRVTSGGNFPSLSLRPQNSGKRDCNTGLTKVVRPKCSQISQSPLHGTRLIVGILKMLASFLL